MTDAQATAVAFDHVSKSFGAKQILSDVSIQGSRRRSNVRPRAQRYGQERHAEVDDIALEA